MISLTQIYNRNVIKFSTTSHKDQRIKYQWINEFEIVLFCSKVFFFFFAEIFPYRRISFLLTDDKSGPDFKAIENWNICHRPYNLICHWQTTNRRTKAIKCNAISVWLEANLWWNCINFKIRKTKTMISNTWWVMSHGNKRKQFLGFWNKQKAIKGNFWFFCSNLKHSVQRLRKSFVCSLRFSCLKETKSYWQGTPYLTANFSTISG